MNTPMTSHEMQNMIVIGIAAFSLACLAAALAVAIYDGRRDK